ncbi:hypothetical protein YB2330_002599 [Saitoella coloradoensis]
MGFDGHGDDWRPPSEQKYKETLVPNLKLGKHNVVVTGRIVSISVFPSKSTLLVLLGVEDASHHIIEVKAYFPTTAPPPTFLHLGARVRVYSTFTAAFDGKKRENEKGEKMERKTVSTVPLFLSLGSGSSTTGIVSVDTNDDGKSESITRGGILSLKEFLSLREEEVECDMRDLKLVVAVKKLGFVRSITTKQGREIQTLAVEVFDESASCDLVFWGDAMCMSATKFTPYSTVLVIDRAHKSTYGTKKQVVVRGDTAIDVDPPIECARWLKSFAQNLGGLVKKREVEIRDEGKKVKVPWIDGEIEWKGRAKVLYTLAQVEEALREMHRNVEAQEEGGNVLMGFLNVIIPRIEYRELEEQGKVFRGECCERIYTAANSQQRRQQICKTCNKPIPLSYNPALVPTLLDEAATLQRPRFTDGAYEALIKIWQEKGAWERWSLVFVVDEVGEEEDVEVGMGRIVICGVCE